MGRQPFRRRIAFLTAGLCAGLLAGLGAGVFASFSAATASIPAPLAPVHPDPAAVERYALAYDRFKRLYPALKAATSAAGQPAIGLS